MSGTTWTQTQTLHQKLRNTWGTSTTKSLRSSSLLSYLIPYLMFLLFINRSCDVRLQMKTMWGQSLNNKSHKTQCSSALFNMMMTIIVPTWRWSRSAPRSWCVSQSGCVPVVSCRRCDASSGSSWQMSSPPRSSTAPEETSSSFLLCQQTNQHWTFLWTSIGNAKLN